MIFTTSRYATGPVVDVADYRRGFSRKIVYRQWPSGAAKFSTYIWQVGDRIEDVAYRVYGRAEAWWQIMDHNPEVVDPTSIKPGTPLRMPT